MARKRKVFHPPSRHSKGGATPDRAAQRASLSLVSIDPAAGLGRDDVSVGSRVTILGRGLYSGEIAVVERLAGGPIPSAVVRTEAGRTRQVRTIDLEPTASSGRSSTPD